MSKESKIYKNMPKKVYIRTFGCQMNFRDSEMVMGMLQDKGFSKASGVNDADVILFNTCSVRQHAEERVFGQLNNLKKLKRQRPDLVVGVIGCMAQEHKDKIIKDYPLVDLVCGTGNIYELPGLIDEKRTDFLLYKDDKKKRINDKIVSCEKVTRPSRQKQKIGVRKGSVSAFVSIMTGCNNFCSYCIVPYVRGREKSRNPMGIVDEVKALVDMGVKEVTLLGQNVNSYVLDSRFRGNDNKGSGNDNKGSRNDKKVNFIKLLEMVNKVDGLERIRFMTSHPKDADKKLFKAMKELDKVCENLHLPMQSGSDRILELMNRKYTSTYYIKLIEDYRKIIPDGAVSTDVIVGFPTETEEDFQKTYNLMKKIQFNSAFIFKYSTRQNTKAEKFKDDVPLRIKKKRNQSLLELQSKITEKKNKNFVGKISEVLVEGKSKKNPGEFIGRIRQDICVVFPVNKCKIGDVVRVRITGVYAKTLRGQKI